jgi:hypothetical protein
MWNDLRPGDEILDAIAEIEVQRQAMAREGQAEAARELSLRKLHELQSREQAELEAQGPSEERLANVQALRAEIERVKALGRSNPRPAGVGKHPPRNKPPRPPRRDSRRRR